MVFVAVLVTAAIGRLGLSPLVHWVVIALVLAAVVVLEYFVMLRRGRMVLIPNALVV